MKNEGIGKLWEDCIKDMFKYTATMTRDLPYIFASPHCTTCAYWQLFGENEMEVMSEAMYDLDYNEICEGIKGKISKGVKENGITVDVYQDYRFFGFCKRYPPLPNDDDQFTVKPKPLLIKADRFIFENKYPITDHEQWCGEWKRGKWYWLERDFLIEMAAKNLKREYSEKEGLPEGWEVFFKD